MSENALVSFGEALIDLVAGKNNASYQAFVGGAPANVAAAVSKLGGKSIFMGSIGADIFGHKIINELKYHNVDTRYLLQLEEVPTAAAYVNLDDDGERSFSFSRRDTADLNYPVDNIPIDLFQSRQGVFHFGSNTLTDDYMTAVTLSLVSMAKYYGWTVSFDVNLRENLWPQNKIDKDRIMTFLNMSDIVKMSIEEVEQLKFEEPSFINQDKTVFVITSGSGPIHLYSKNDKISHIPAKVKAIDTTGAGDAFFGGFLFSVCEQGLFNCSANDYTNAIEFAARCGAHSVQSKGAISSYPHYEEVS